MCRWKRGFDPMVHLSLMSALPNRVARLTTALLTVWCLGCSSFDALVDHLLGRAPSTACVSASDAPNRTGTSAVLAADDQLGATDAVGCCCDHCVALRTAASMPLRAPSPEVQVFETLIKMLRSIESVPLVPPPLA